MKTILLLLFAAMAVNVSAQYLAVKARYTETRLIDDAPNPPRRENRLVLSFHNVTTEGTYSPATLSNFDLYIQPQGYQYGNAFGDVRDSAGNNYEGYAWTAPKAVAYFNTLGRNYIDCSPSSMTHYTVNGHELDCGFISVSRWDTDISTGLPIEIFTAPNIGLPYYIWPEPMSVLPGNINFAWPVFPTAPYNNYNFDCGGTLQMVMRGVLAQDTGGSVTVLPILFANLQAGVERDSSVVVSFSNLTESDVLHYAVEYSRDGILFRPVSILQPSSNAGGAAHYAVQVVQHDQVAYYRVRGTETSGQNYLSKIVTVKLERNGLQQTDDLLVYPNPASGSQITMQLTNAQEGRYIAAMITPGGRELQQKLVVHNGGDLSRTFQMSGLPAGIYQLVLRGAERRYAARFVYVR